MKLKRDLKHLVLLAVLLVAAAAVPALGQNAAAPLAAAQESIEKPAPAPEADKEGLARCGLYGLVALYGVGSGVCGEPEPDERDNAIGVLDARNNVISLITMECLLGSNGGGIFDIAITQDCTALVSNFGDRTIHFIDFSDPLNPLHKGSVLLPFFAEDIALTPDGEFALVTDGGFTSSIAVIRTSTMHLVGAPDFGGVYSNAVAVAADGRTVLTADYFNGRVNVFLLGEGGALQFVKAIQLFTDTDGVEPNTSHRPVNVAISPNGRTAVVANANGGSRDDPPTYYAYPPDLDLFRIDGPGQVSHSGVIHMPNVGGVQTVGFANNSQIFFNFFRYFEYYYQVPDPEDPEAPGTIHHVPYPQHYIGFADIVGPGEAVNTGIEVDAGVKGTSQLFGVDTLVAVPGGPYLYYANPTLSGGTDEIQVIDLRDHTLVKTIDMPNSDLTNIFGPPWGVVICCEGYIPLGIAFRQP